MSEKLIELAWYLLGERYKNNHAIVWNASRKSCVPVVSSPIANYIHEINRFLFDGGLNIDVQQAKEDDPRQALINSVIDLNRVQSSLESVLITGMITGELLCVLRLCGSSYSFEYFDKLEFDYDEKDGQLTKVLIKTDRILNNETWVYRLDITSEAFIEYPLVEKRFEHNYDWEANKEVKPHTYGFIPAVVIKNKIDIGSRRGVHEFNFAACKMAASIILATFDGLENLHLFGNPMFASPDPDDTLKRLRARIQVLQKEASEDGGTVDVLNFNPIDPEHLKVINKLEDNFNRQMGIRVGNDMKSADVSSITLRMLNSATISKAESKAQNYVEDGLKIVFETCLRMAAIDGILLSVNVSDKATYEVRITRKKPYFVESPQEISQLLVVANQMVDLGVDRVEALKSTIWPHLSYSQIEEKLRMNLEDI